MLLHTLLRLYDPAFPVAGLSNVPLSGIQEDSRLVRPGDLFLARPGLAADGTAFIADACARGAAAVVTPRAVEGVAVPQVVLADPNAAASPLAHLFYGDPSRKVKVLGITGTNGKTTTAFLLRHLLASVRDRCGMIGTVEVDDGRHRREAALTTPGAVEVAALLASMREHGAWRCAMEVSSHALDQGRVSGVRFAAAGFTNLTGDHLDYHKDMDAYAAAKARLFASLDASAVAVVNGGDRWSERMTRDCRARVIRYGFAAGDDYRAEDLAPSARGTSFVLVTPDGRATVRTGLIGRHNVENALLAAALAGEALGMTLHPIAAGLRDAAGAPGRLQAVGVGQPFAVLVDYAHTDDALENVLTALRPLARGKLRVMFGCGGDRDKTKRPRMARAAERHADVVYVTSDNPRGEIPAAILDDIRAGFSPAGRQAAVFIEDRRAAIERVLADAEAGDVVLLAGKGHENYQIIRGVKHPFDDAAEARRVMGEVFSSQ